MESNGAQKLPADLFHLLSIELAARKDFGTLYNCIISGKHLANTGAVAALYRISHESPVTSGGSETAPIAEQDLNIMRWSILWRTIILSALGKTLYPYCRHIRELDLRDLYGLLERLDETKFRGKVTKKFFEGDLARFHMISKSPAKWQAGRLEAKKIMHAVGDEITQQAPLLEGLSEPPTMDVLSGVLATWAPRLGYLQELELSDGKVLADETLRNLLHAHCPKLNQLRLYRFTGDEADHHLASFIAGLQENTLTSFVNISACGIGLETCLSLNGHGKSLAKLQLALDEEGLLALGLLQGCTSLTFLEIESLRQSVDLKATQHDVYLEMIEWLKNCDHLRDISFNQLVSAPDLLLPVLLNKSVKLQELQINAKEGSMYLVKDHHDFHAALGGQTSLHKLFLRADPDPISRDDIEALMAAFCSLQELRVLNLARVSDYFSDEHISLLAECLSSLEELSVGGYGISDAVLNSLCKLQNLKQLTFSGITRFSAEGLLEFVEQLGPGNEGLAVSIDLADPDSGISEEAQDLIREAIFAKINGRFEYQLLRDPNAPEFDSSDSD